MSRFYLDIIKRKWHRDENWLVHETKQEGRNPRIGYGIRLDKLAPDELVTYLNERLAKEPNND